MKSIKNLLLIIAGILGAAPVNHIAFAMDSNKSIVHFNIPITAQSNKLKAKIQPVLEITYERNTIAQSEIATDSRKSALEFAINDKTKTKDLSDWLTKLHTIGHNQYRKTSHAMGKTFYLFNDQKFERIWNGSTVKIKKQLENKKNDESMTLNSFANMLYKNCINQESTIEMASKQEINTSQENNTARLMKNIQNMQKKSQPYRFNNLAWIFIQDIKKPLFIATSLCLGGIGLWYWFRARK